MTHNTKKIELSASSAVYDDECDLFRPKKSGKHRSSSL